MSKAHPIYSLVFGDVSELICIDIPHLQISRDEIDSPLRMKAMNIKISEFRDYPPRVVISSITIDEESAPGPTVLNVMGLKKECFFEIGKLLLVLFSPSICVEYFEVPTSS